MSTARGALAAAGVAVAMLAIGAAVLLSSGQPAAEASSLSRGGRGWLAARRYLEERGCEVRLLDRDLAEAVAANADVLVVAFPWQSTFAEGAGTALDRQLQAGGHVLFAYSGRASGVAESIVAGALDLEWTEVGGRPPLHPARWWKHAAEEWWLTGEGLRPSRIRAPQRIPRGPGGAAVRVLARDAGGRAVAFSYPRGLGGVVVLPSDVFSNARLREPGNADLLELLRQELGAVWAFDEFHHGLRDTASHTDRGGQRVLLLYLGQLAFVYALVAFAVGPRLGPPWREPVAASGSVAAFLLGLGALHERLGHHNAAARALRVRAQELDRRIVLPVVREGGDFLELAREVGRMQAGRRKTG